MWRYTIGTIVAGIALTNWQAGARDVTDSWYPTQPGTSWTYLHESRDAGNRGIVHPMIERWTTEETIVSTRSIPEGTWIEQRTRAFDHVMLEGWLPENDATKRLPPESYALLHGSCLYQLQETSRDDPDDIWDALDRNHQIRAQYREALQRGNVAPAFCFPMTMGASWGRTAETDPAENDVWRVKALNGDPFGEKGGRTFHLFAHQGSGTVADVWFAQGVGVLQEVVEHHGTYIEDRRQLLSTTIGGAMRTYSLTPARTIPLYESECQAGWRHFVRADGSLISNMAACISYARSVRR